MCEEFFNLAMVIIGVRLSMIHGTPGPSSLPMALSQILSRALRCMFGLFVIFNNYLFNSFKNVKGGNNPL